MSIIDSGFTFAHRRTCCLALPRSNPSPSHLDTSRCDCTRHPGTIGGLLRRNTSEIATANVYEADALAMRRRPIAKMSHGGETGFCLAAPLLHRCLSHLRRVHQI